MKTYYIYKATNISNQKSYIGFTKDIGSRITQHIRTAKDNDTEFRKALNEYGIKNFTWQIIDTCFAKEDGVVLEAKYIKEYGTVYPNGYNMAYSNGGSPTTRPIICLTLESQYVKKYEYLSQAVEDGFDINSIKASLKYDTRTANGHIFMYEDDYLKNGAKTYKKPVSVSRKKIIQCDLNGKFINEFESVSEAAEKNGFLRSNISANLCLMQKTCNDYIFVYKENYPIKDLSIYKKKRKGKRVCQLDMNTLEVIAIYDCLSDAGRALGKEKGHRNIQKIVNNLDKSAYGYRWMYEEDYNLQYANTEVIT